MAILHKSQGQSLRGFLYPAVDCRKTGRVRDNCYAKRKLPRILFVCLSLLICRILSLFYLIADPEGPGFAAFLLTALSVLLIVVTMPFSLCLCIKVSGAA